MSSVIKFFVVLCLIALCNGGYAQNSVNSSQQGISENSAVSLSSVDESTITLAVQEPSSSAADTGNSFFLVLRMIFVLAIVIVLIYGVLLFLKKTNATERNNDMFLRQVASVNVAPGKSVQIVTLTDKHAFLIGVSDNSVNLISKIDDIELVQAMNLYADRKGNTKKPGSFAEVLDLFMPGSSSEDKNVFDGASAKLSELLKKQRNRLDNGE